MPILQTRKLSLREDILAPENIAKNWQSGFESRPAYLHTLCSFCGCHMDPYQPLFPKYTHVGLY